MPLVVRHFIQGVVAFVLMSMRALPLVPSYLRGPPIFSQTAKTIAVLVLAGLFGARS